MRNHTRVDVALIAKAKAGNKQALAKIFDLFIERVYRFVYVRVGSREDAEDIAAQVFVKIVTNIGSYEERGFPFEAWLFRIVRNQITDFYRQKKNHLVPLDAAMHVVDPNPLPEERVVKKLEYEEVLAVMPKLPDTYQEIIALKFIEERENDEISAILGKPVDQVRVLQSRALAKLKSLLKL